MNFTVEGKIVRVFDRLSGVSQGGKEWQKQEYLLETQEQYPQQIHFSVFGQDKVNAVSAELGDMVKLTFSISSREWNGRWYTSVEAQFMDQINQTEETGKKTSKKKTVEAQQVNTSVDDGSDLPF